MHILNTTWSQKWDDPFLELTKLEGKVYRELEGRKTFRFEKDNQAYFAKVHWGVGWKEIFKNLLYGRLPILSAKNEWLAIKRLEQLNLPTMRLVGYGCYGINPAKLKSFVITEELAPIISLQDLSQQWSQIPPAFALKNSILRALAHIARTLHENGVNHRDFYICHFLLDTPIKINKLTPTSIKIYLIDLHRVQLRSRTPKRWRIKDISGLYFSCMDIGLTRRDLFRFMKLYRQKPLRKTLKEDRFFWLRVHNRATKLYYKTFKQHPKI